MENTQSQTETFDPVWGAHAIAGVLKTTDQRAFYMLNKGELPAKKVGGRWVADRNELIKFMKTMFSESKEDAA